MFFVWEIKEGGGDQKEERKGRRKQKFRNRGGFHGRICGGEKTTGGGEKKVKKWTKTGVSKGVWGGVFTVSISTVELNQYKEGTRGQRKRGRKRLSSWDPESIKTLGAERELVEQGGKGKKKKKNRYKLQWGGLNTRYNTCSEKSCSE